MGECMYIIFLWLPSHNIVTFWISVNTTNEHLEICIFVIQHITLSLNANSQQCRWLYRRTQIFFIKWIALWLLYWRASYLLIERVKTKFIEYGITRHLVHQISCLITSRKCCYKGLNHLRLCICYDIIFSPQVFNVWSVVKLLELEFITFWKLAPKVHIYLNKE